MILIHTTHSNFLEDIIKDGFLTPSSKNKNLNNSYFFLVTINMNI